MIDQESTKLNYLKDKIINVQAFAITDSNNKIYQMERQRKHFCETMRKYLSTLSDSCIIENYLIKGEHGFYHECMTVLENQYRKACDVINNESQATIKQGFMKSEAPLKVINNLYNHVTTLLEIMLIDDEMTRRINLSIIRTW